MQVRIPFVANGLLLLGLVGGFFALEAPWKTWGAPKEIARDQKAVLSGSRRTLRCRPGLSPPKRPRLPALQGKTQTVIAKIDNAPKTAGCGSVMRDACHGVRESFQRASGADAGCQPAVALSG
jgi:hypothetical protein